MELSIALGQKLILNLDVSEPVTQPRIASLRREWFTRPKSFFADSPRMTQVVIEIGFSLTASKRQPAQLFVQRLASEAQNQVLVDKPEAVFLSLQPADPESVQKCPVVSPQLANDRFLGLGPLPVSLGLLL